MRKCFHIVLALLVLASCGPERISRDNMEHIIRDMLVQDQQIRNNQQLRKQADTSLVYEGIFRKYGYTTDDFLYSLEYYLEDASRMEKVMSSVADDLEKELKGVKKEVALEQWRERMLRIYHLPVDTSRFPHPRPRAVDSLQVRADGSRIYLYKEDSIRMRDLDTILFREPDSLSAAAPDSLSAAPDSLSVKPSDSL